MAKKNGAVEERALPNNLDAEKAVLGAILMHGAAYLEVAPALTPAMFYRVAHRQAFAAMAAVLEERKEALDFVTLKAELERRGELADVGGPAYLAALIDGLPRRSHVAHYAGLVREAAQLRGLITAGNALVAAAYAATEAPAVLLRKADRMLLELQAGGDRRALAKFAVGDLSNDLETRVGSKGVLRGIGTGFASIDAETMGWQPGDLIIVAARPSIGKTTFAVNSAVAAAITGKAVAIFSLEMRRLQIEYRMLSSLSGVPLRKILSGYLADADYPNISGGLMALDALPIYITDRGGQTAWDIRLACRRLRNEHPLDLIVIDYVQLMPGSLDRRGATRNEEITDISRRLKELADELALPVLLLSQLNRGAEGRLDPRPKLADLRESGALEQDADLVCFLHRKHHREGGVTNFIIEKQRNGPTGTVNLTLDRDITLFTDGGEERQPTAEEVQAEKDERARKAIRRKVHSR